MRATKRGERRAWRHLIDATNANEYSAAWERIAGIRPFSCDQNGRAPLVCVCERRLNLLTRAPRGAPDRGRPVPTRIPGRLQRVDRSSHPSALMHDWLGAEATYFS